VVTDATVADIALTDDTVADVALTGNTVADVVLMDMLLYLRMLFTDVSVIQHVCERAATHLSPETQSELTDVLHER